MLFSELRDKEVVCLGTGARLGTVDDIEFDDNAHVLRLYIYGRAEMFGFGGRSDDIVIEWEHVDTIGSDIILVSAMRELPAHARKKNGFFM